jgi:hypothetical protein
VIKIHLYQLRCQAYSLSHPDSVIDKVDTCIVITDIPPIINMWNQVKKFNLFKKFHIVLLLYFIIILILIIHTL